MVRIFDPRLINSEIELEETPEFYNLDPNFINALSHLIGYDGINDKTRLVRVDSDGNLLISTSGSSSTDIEVSRATVTTVSQVIVNSRSSRKGLVIKNTGSTDIYIDKDTNVTSSTGYLLESGGVISFDNFTGSVFGIAITGSNDIHVMETV